MDSAERAQWPVVANISNRHIHLCQGDLEKLFGSGYTLTKTKDLMQPGEHACQETLKIVGKKGEIDRVRVLGPLRRFTQVEISMTDNIQLGMNAPIRCSGDIAGSAPVRIVGPAGTIDLAEGCIVAKRHVHMTTADAGRYGIKDGDILRLQCGGERGLVFGNVVARVSDKMVLECHLDTDEANAAGLRNGDRVTIL
jgi:putative phosphotransacetylase